MQADTPTLYREVRELFNGVKVHLVSRVELGLWEHLVCEHRYLGFNGLVGESLPVFVRALRENASQRLSDPYLPYSFNKKPKPSQNRVRKRGKPVLGKMWHER